MNSPKEIIQLHVKHNILDTDSLEKLSDLLVIYDKQREVNHATEINIREETHKFQAKLNPESRDLHHRPAYIAWSMGGNVAGQAVTATRK
jgi:hypothetical protein